jgi:hypothetical protein
MNFSFVHDFDLDPQTYWKLFLSEEFNEELFRELKMKSRSVLKQTDDGKLFHRVQKMEPSTKLPGFLESMVKDTGYTEIDTLDWQRSAMEIVIEPAMLKERFVMRGMYSVTPLDSGARCRREFKGDVKVSMALIGGKVEKFMLEELRSAYEVAARVTRQWIAEKKPYGPYRTT